MGLRRRSTRDRDGGSSWMGPLPRSEGCDCHVCRPDPAYPPHDRQAIDAVLEHGWQVMIVSSDVPCSDPDHDHEDHTHDPEGSSPGFAYTLGLGHCAGHPELLMSGLDPAVMHRALNDAATRVLAGRRLRPGDVLEDVLAGVPVVVEDVSDLGLRETVTWSGWFHRRKPSALVLVWPTTSGLFAWQPGAPAVLDEAQPTQWREPIIHGGGVATDPEWLFPVPADTMAFSCVHVVEQGLSPRWAARETDATRGEDWTVHCGEVHDTAEMRMTHLAHLVRSAPSLREVADLGLDEEAVRDGVDEPWVRARLV